MNKMIDYVELRAQLSKYGQEQLLQFWDELTTSEQENLAQELLELNLPQLQESIEKATKLNKNPEIGHVNLDEKLQPLPAEKLMYLKDTDKETLDSYRQEGLRQIARGHVAVLLMAGGQGTRLGSSDPKGMYNVGLLSKKSLFCLQAERIRSLERLASIENPSSDGDERMGHITWYIMTSEHTRQPTQNYLETMDYFGLRRENVILFEQGSMPCLSFDGKILLDQKSHISRAPDGNGGIYGALQRQGILEDMERRGIHYIHCHSVDNILVKVADPIFIGYCVQEKADCAAKVVEKVVANEAVGVVAIVDGSIQVVEYSELSSKNAEMRSSNDDNGHRLVYNAGNICNHLFELEFLKRICSQQHESQLKLHVAKKKIPYVDNSGKRITPQSPNGIKIEKFVFDVFEFSERFVAMMVAREEEFSALKNSDAVGKDCPSTSRRDLYRLHKRYIEDAGGLVHGDECEISPLLSYDGENLESLVKGKSFTSPILLDSTNK